MFIASVSIILAYACQRRCFCIVDDENNVTISFNKVLFYCSFIALAMLSFVVVSGKDVYDYAFYYTNWDISQLDSSIFEFGYVLLCILFRTVFKNPFVGLGIFKIISLFLVYRSFYVLRNKIHIGNAVLAYVLMLYTMSFNLIRMFLSIGLVFLAFSYCIIQKHKKAVILILIACSIHYSSLLALVVYIVYRLFFKKKSAVKLAVFLGCSIVGVFLSGEIFTLAKNSYNFLSKYDPYFNKTMVGGIGLYQFILFAPIIFIIIKNYKTKVYEQSYIFSSLVGIMTFSCGFSGYFYPVISRSVYYFYYYMIVYASSFSGKLLPNRNNRIKIESLMQIGYVLLNSFTYLFLSNGLVSNGLDEIVFIWSRL